MYINIKIYIYIYIYHIYIYYMEVFVTLGFIISDFFLQSSLSL